MFLVENLYWKYKKYLSLQLVEGKEGLKKQIAIPEPQRPGIALTGFIKGFSGKRILVFGKPEIEYLHDLSPTKRKEKLQTLFSFSIPAVIIARRYRPPEELITLCTKLQIPLFKSTMSTMPLLSRLVLLLGEEFSSKTTCHGTLVEVFGVGVLIQGDSSVGKSEAALGLIEHGHRLISDDIVVVKNMGERYLEGSGAELTRHHMEIRGIGIINVADLYGAVCVRDSKRIDLVVKLEEWEENHFYDRIGLDEKFCNILDVQLPFHVLPVKPGRDVVLLLETIALNHRLKGGGRHSAREFSTKLLSILGNDLKEEVKKGEIRAEGEGQK